ncbi:MAG: nitroreductase family protein [Bacteroidales bacterium]|jgi:nitroreductase|nr:nitroreductase family protein [Bacteroidales bacterium]
MNKDAVTQYPINEFARKRWSPRIFLNKPVEQERLVSIFEAARWSASSMNEQPWRFIIGIKPDESWNKIFETLVKENQVWAQSAPVLTIVCGKKTYSRNNNPSAIFPYDVGQSVAHLSIEAMHQGIYVHQMGGFSTEKAIALFDIPIDFQPLTAIAIGFIGDPESLPGTLKTRELASRSRKNLKEIVFREKFGTPGLTG